MCQDERKQLLARIADTERERDAAQAQIKANTETNERITQLNSQVILENTQLRAKAVKLEDELAKLQAELVKVNAALAHVSSKLDSSEKALEQAKQDALAKEFDRQTVQKIADMFSYAREHSLVEAFDKLKKTAVDKAARTALNKQFPNEGSSVVEMLKIETTYKYAKADDLEKTAFKETKKLAEQLVMDAGLTPAIVLGVHSKVVVPRNQETHVPGGIDMREAEFHKPEVIKPILLALQTHLKSVTKEHVKSFVAKDEIDAMLAALLKSLA